VLITGASSGIGAELARNFAKEGAKIALISRSVKELEAVAAECLKLGSSRAEVFNCDITDNAQTNTAMKAAVASFGRFDVVILNAGRSQGCYFDEIKDVEQIDYMLELNANGPIKILHHLLPSVPKASSSRIVLISSISGLIGVPYRTIYCSSKFALSGFANALRIEFGDKYGDAAPRVTLINFPEVGGTELNSNRMDMGAERPPAQFDTSGILSVEEACVGAMTAVAGGVREWGHPAKISVLLPLYRLIPSIIDGIILKTVKKTHYRS